MSTHTHNLPVSRKAYIRFRERIERINTSLGSDPAYMLGMLDEYLAGNRQPGDDSHPQQNFAFMFLRDDIDLAIARSAHAREAARRRRERKKHEHPESRRDKRPDDSDSADQKKIDEDYARYVQALKDCIRASNYPTIPQSQSLSQDLPIPQQRDPRDACGRRPHEILAGYRYKRPFLSDDPTDIVWTDGSDEENDSPYHY